MKQNKSLGSKMVLELCLRNVADNFLVLDLKKAERVLGNQMEEVYAILDPDILEGPTSRAHVLAVSDLRSDFCEEGYREAVVISR